MLIIIIGTSSFMFAVCVLLAGTSPCTKFLRLVPSCVPTLMEVENGENGWGGGSLIELLRNVIYFLNR